jgi:hypothetical protein
MSRFVKIQEALKEVLRARPGIPADVEITARRKKDVINDIKAALDKLGICISVMPPLPRKATRTQNNIIFFESAWLVIRITEDPLFNNTAVDGWDLMEEVMLALQGENPNRLFAAPLGLADRPVEPVEYDSVRCFEVIFEGAFQLTR